MNQQNNSSVNDHDVVDVTQEIFNRVKTVVKEWIPDELQAGQDDS